MNEAEFNRAADALMRTIEDELDAQGVDIDTECAGGVLTLVCEANGSRIILSRQPALAQIWLAAKSGGFHFEFCNDNWIATTGGESLATVLGRVCSAQAGAPIVFKLS